ncbi:autotransporter outer membrane beta-barrel domain-containing protein|uniref:autotransporter family protein n=1 Tax=Stenotrophomonas sp. SbOxS2 TaxID=2723885 RepID=UPI0015D31C80|nr:autotransporter outer membrane beta-barrel domain-containing protein [Stenotrophomonas sp. SbOxS2]NYT99599.1 autotransporter outer membrane beta-barrel domain-containing protein [Stenotrophomonas sp. SbOxS2]
MKNLSPRARHPHPAQPARLAGCLVLALTSVAGSATSRELVGESEQVVPGQPAEAWQLRLGSQLQVTDAEALNIQASGGSSIRLSGATVRDSSFWLDYAILLEDTSSLVAHQTSILGNGLQVSGTASAELVGSRIDVTQQAGLDPWNWSSIGVDLDDLPGTTSDARVVLDSTHVQVEQVEFQQPGYTGIGTRQAQGQLFIRNGSYIDAADIGALLYSGGSAVQSSLAIDDSTVIGRTGAAIRIAALLGNPNFDIHVSNGSQLHGGDGNLLRVASFVPLAAVVGNIGFTVDNARLSGNIDRDSNSAGRGTLDVFLRNNAQIDGRFINVTSADIGTDSTWLMTGDSNVGHLTLDSTGTVALGDGSSFNTLSVDTFTGNGGTLGFNTVLGGDSSATDKLVIAGDANGQANVRVLNAGGAGAKTDKGIELIRVGGASNAQFDLQGRAVGGQYEYFLFKDATNGGWYLRSELATTPDPCLADPTLPQCKPIVDPVDPIDPIEPPTPVLRPEAGAYLANQFAMHQLLRHGWRDRQGGTANDGVRGWARVDGTQSKLSAVEEQLDLRVDRSRLQLGADVGVFDNGRGRVGVMGTVAQSSATSRSQLTGYSARGKVEGGALGVYGNWNSDAVYVDASVQRGQFRNRVQGEGLSEERYDSDLWQSSLEAGYRIGIGAIGSTALSLQPELQLVYTDANIDVHTETNGTVVRSQGDSGLSGRIGLRLQGEGHSAAGASVSPYLAANWYRDGASNGIAFDDEVLKAGIPRNRYELSAGARLEFRSGLSAWGGFGVMRGDHGYREATANLSVAYTW